MPSCVSLSTFSAMWWNGVNGIFGPNCSGVLRVRELEERQRAAVAEPEEQWQYVRSSPNSTSFSHQVAISGRPMTSS